MIDKYAKLLSSRLDDLIETLTTTKSKGKLAANDIRSAAGVELDAIQSEVDDITGRIQEFYRKLPEVESNRGFTHRYVEFFVRLFEQGLPGGLAMVRVPAWYAKAWGMPDSAWYKGKTLGYHVGHIVAVAMPLVVIGTAITAIALSA